MALYINRERYAVEKTDLFGTEVYLVIDNADGSVASNEHAFDTRLEAQQAADSLNMFDRVRRIVDQQVDQRRTEVE